MLLRVTERETFSMSRNMFFFVLKTLFYIDDMFKYFKSIRPHNQNLKQPYN